VYPCVFSLTQPLYIRDFGSYFRGEARGGRDTRVEICEKPKENRPILAYVYLRLPAAFRIACSICVYLRSSAANNGFCCSRWAGEKHIWRRMS